MEQFIPFIFIGVVVLIFILAVAANKKRQKALLDLSETLQMKYTQNPDALFLESYTGFKLFSSGRAPKASNLMLRKLNETETAAFDYRYTTGGGKNSSTHHQTVVSAFTRGVTLPSFIMGPEYFVHRIAQKFTGEDINFERHPGFSKMFELKGENEIEIRRMFRDEVIRLLEDKKGLNMEAKGNRIIFYRTGKPCSPNQLEEFIRDCLEIYTLMLQGLR